MIYYIGLFITVSVCLFMFGGLFLSIWKQEGLGAALFVFLGTGAVLGLLVLGLHLMEIGAG
jgi:hypothetical protein